MENIKLLYPFLKKDFLYALALFVGLILIGSTHLSFQTWVLLYILVLGFYLGVLKKSLGNTGAKLLTLFRVLTLVSIFGIVWTGYFVIRSIITLHFVSQNTYVVMLSALVTILSYTFLTNLTKDKSLLNNIVFFFVTIGSYFLLYLATSLLFNHLVYPTLW